MVAEKVLEYENILLMKKKFVAFGDSWPWGMDLKPGEKSYGELIAEHKGMEFQNCSEPATAGEHMILQLQHMINTSSFVDTEYTALFSFTRLARFMYFSDNPIWDKKFRTNSGQLSWDGTAPNDDQATALYYKYIHSAKLDNFKFYTTAMVLQKLCQEYNIKDYYALSFSTVDWPSHTATQSRSPLTAPPGNNFIGLDRHKFWDQGNTNFLTLFGCEFIDQNNKYFGHTGGHPNQLGHELIAQHLRDWIGQ